MGNKLLMALVFVLFLLVSPAFASGAQDSSSQKGYPLGVVAKEPVTINIWQISGAGVEYINKAIALYVKDHPNVKFNLTVQSDEFMDTNLTTTLATKPTDLDISFFWQGTRIRTLAEQGLIANLDDWYAYYKWDDVFQSGARSANYVEGFGHVAFNWDWYAYGVIFYNKALFQKAGAAVPKTLEEFWSACEKLKQAGIEPMAMGGKDAWPYHLVWNQMIGRYLSTKDANLLSTWGVNAKKTKADAAVFKSDGALKTWQFIADMNKKGYFSPGVNSLDWNDSNERFAAGKAAMISGFMPGSFADARKQDPNIPVDYFIMPDKDAKDRGICVSYNDVFVIPVMVPPVKRAVLADFLNRTLVDPAFVDAGLKAGLNLSTGKITAAEVTAASGNAALGRFFEEMKGRPVLENTDMWLSAKMIKEYYNDLMEVSEGTMPPEQATDRLYTLATEEVK